MAGAWGASGWAGLSNQVSSRFLSVCLLSMQVGMLVASPVFAHLARTVQPFRLLAVGMTTWLVCTFCCGLAQNFTQLLLCRMVLGVGESSFIALAAPFIDDAAPPSQKARWLAAFYMCIPVGVAAGYVLGGLLAGALGWRAAFFVESSMMTPLALFYWTAKPARLNRGVACKRGGKCGVGSLFEFVLFEPQPPFSSPRRWVNPKQRPTTK